MMEVFVPRESVNDDSVIVQKVLVSPGTVVRGGEVVVEIETSKTVLEIAAPAAGRIQHELAVGQEVTVGGLLFRIADGAEPSPATGGSRSDSLPGTETQQHPSNVTLAASGGVPLLSRAAEAAAARLGANLAQFGGAWVTSADIQRMASGATEQAPRGGGVSARVKSAQDSAVGREQSAREYPVRVPFKPVVRSKRKRAEIESLVSGQHSATTSTIGIRIVLPGDRMASPGFLFKDSIADLVVFEGARLIKDFPELNGFHLDEKTSGYYQEVNFGLSFDNQHNLKVLALRGADRIGLPEIQRTFTELLELYESNKTIPTELLETATITVSDLSMAGASFMLPLLNGRQSLILGVVRHQPRQFELFASFDHRLSEGLRVARFLTALRDRILSHYRDAGGVAQLSCDACGRSMQDEVRLGSRGFVRVVLPSGADASLCRNCFEGR